MSKQELPEIRENPDVQVDPPPDPPGHVAGGVGYRVHEQIPPVTPDPPRSAQVSDEEFPDEVQQGDGAGDGGDENASEPPS